MAKLIFCKKLQKELPALKIPPMPGPKGLELMETISAEAWEAWKTHQVTLINEKKQINSEDIFIAVEQIASLLESMEKRRNSGLN